jgi:hypothetical protein
MEQQDVRRFDRLTRARPTVDLGRSPRTIAKTDGQTEKVHSTTLIHRCVSVSTPNRKISYPAPTNYENRLIYTP